MIALDLDNTIICHDAAFHAAAVTLDCLPTNQAPTKASIKSAALEHGGNELWTRLQGIAYGEKIHHSTLFPGCAEFIASTHEDLVIVSHKTQFPAIGTPTDLHLAARDWLSRTPLSGIPVHFLPTREEKVATLAKLSPRLLIDDLPEVFQSPGFPSATHFILFDPTDSHPEWTTTPRIRSWHQAPTSP
jgi:hypothetical protein